jgi:putative tryptophan/tyrosine transport system substrate-binding protein
VNRREFITLVGGATIAYQPAASAQQRGKPQRIGLLMPVSAEAAAANVAAFRQGLRDLGYVEGRDVALEYRYANGKDNLLPGFTAELVRVGVDVILTWGTPSARAAKDGTSTIPIVMAAIADPTGTGIVQSLARPGGNVTGLTSIAVEIDGKRLELLREIAPTISRVGVFWNPTNPVGQVLVNQTKLAAASLGLELLLIPIQDVGHFEQAFATFTSERLNGLTVNSDTLFLDNQTRILDFAAQARIPATYPYREFVDAGGLMYYGPNYLDLFRRAATHVDKILKGAAPGDLPVEQPTNFELVVNLKAARALGLAVPQSILVRANEVIE